MTHEQRVERVKEMLIDEVLLSKFTQFMTEADLTWDDLEEMSSSDWISEVVPEKYWNEESDNFDQKWVDIDEEICCNICEGDCSWCSDSDCQYRSDEYAENEWGDSDDADDDEDY